METILEIKDVKKRFGAKEILKGINLSVMEGEIISVLGPSGCGKSTLLNIIAGILPLDGGEVSIHQSIVSAPEKWCLQRNVISTWCFRISHYGLI